MYHTALVYILQQETMKAFGKIAVLFSLASAAEAWTPAPPTDPARATKSAVTKIDNASPVTVGKNAYLNRRNFVATSIAGAVLAGTSLESALAAPANGLSLVAPDAVKGKVVVITGGTTGIGLESGKALAKGGATVVLTARTDQKGAKAVGAVQNYLQTLGLKNDKVTYVQLDLDNLDNVKTFPQRFEQKLGSNTKIDVLMNNAGASRFINLLKW